MKTIIKIFFWSVVIAYVFVLAFDITMDKRCERGDYFNSEVREMACGGGDKR